MDKAIIDLINAKGKSALARMSAAKAKTFRLSAYAGLRFYYDNCTLSMIADEIGYSDGGTHKLLSKWKDTLSSGNVAANSIDQAYASIRAKKTKVKKDASPIPPQTPAKTNAAKRVTLPSTYVGPEEMAAYEAEKASNPKPKKGRYCLGFLITPEDDLRMRAAIRGSIRFFTKYGKGRNPRTNGEYFSPDDNAAVDDKTVWIIQDQAVLYCGCKEDMILAAVERGEIKRRIYKRSGNHVYYEYSCADLDKFIQNNNLL